MKKKSLLPILLLTGCATSQVVPVKENQKDKIDKICVEHNPKVIVNNFEEIITNRLEDHGISHQIYNKNEKPPQCDYTMKYVAFQKWDLSMILTEAELRLYKGDIKIGGAEYKLNAGGLLNPTKYKSTESKINPLIDQLLGR